MLPDRPHRFERQHEPEAVAEREVAQERLRHHVLQEARPPDAEQERRTSLSARQRVPSKHREQNPEKIHPEPTTSAVQEAELQRGRNVRGRLTGYPPVPVRTQTLFRKPVQLQMLLPCPPQRAPR